RGSARLPARPRAGSARRRAGRVRCPAAAYGGRGSRPRRRSRSTEAAAPRTQPVGRAKLGGFGLVLARGLDRTRVLALGLDIALDELDQRHCRGVAVAEARLDDAGVAALPLLVALGEHGEELLDQLGVLQARERLAPRVQA